MWGWVVGQCILLANVSNGRPSFRLPPSRGIPWISSDREVRVRAIADQLAGGDYDVVSLQEVWSPADYEYIRDRVAEVLPYAHYFYSGVIGSGLCLFARHPIVGALFHAWPLNGYVHRVHHGDWFGGKGVGLCRLSVHGRLVNVYIAHVSITNIV